MKTITKRCEGSGKRVRLDWFPDKEKTYPGAAVCECMLGVPVLKYSVRRTEDGYMTGVLRVHRTPPICTECNHYVQSIQHDYFCGQ